MENNKWRTKNAALSLMDFGVLYSLPLVFWIRLIIDVKLTFLANPQPSVQGDCRPWLRVAIRATVFQPDCLDFFCWHNCCNQYVSHAGELNHCNLLNGLLCWKTPQHIASSAFFKKKFLLLFGITNFFWSLEKKSVSVALALLTEL